MVNEEKKEQEVERLTEPDWLEDVELAEGGRLERVSGVGPRFRDLSPADRAVMRPVTGNAGTTKRLASVERPRAKVPTSI